MNIPMTKAVGESLTMWTIYERPVDMLDMKYVARRWTITGGTATPSHEAFGANSLDDIRAFLPPGLVRVPRHPEDDPTIVETWL